MTLDKRPGTAPGTVDVTFRIPAEAGAHSACLAGDFSGWSTTATPMDESDGGFVVSLALEQGDAYRFRCFVDGERSENDWGADGYVQNEFGGDDSVVDIPPSDTVEAELTDEPASRRSKRARGKPQRG